jgi:hypothetical protein
MTVDAAVFNSHELKAVPRIRSDVGIGVHHGHGHSLVAVQCGQRQEHSMAVIVFLDTQVCVVEPAADIIRARRGD